MHERNDAVISTLLQNRGMRYFPCPLGVLLFTIGLRDPVSDGVRLRALFRCHCEAHIRC